MIRARFSLALSLLGAAVCLACSSAGAPSPTTATANAADAGGASGASTSLGVPAGAVDCAEQPGVDRYTPGLQKAGESGAFAFELVSSTPAPPALHDNTFVVRVSGADGSPLAGELSAVLDMPEHGHTSPEAPVITFDPSSGSFTLDPMYFFMVGLWRVTLTFEPAPGVASGAAGAGDSALVSDSAEFHFCVD